MAMKINLIDVAGMCKPLVHVMLILILAIPFTVHSSEPEHLGTILHVDSKLVDCVGEMPMKCMLTKKENESDWSLFYDHIEGFNYEKGYRYTLLVNITEVKNPPQDASSIHYQLIKIIKKE